MKKLLIALFAAVLAVSAGASSGNKSAQTPKAPDWPIAFPTAKEPIQVSPTFTPFFRMDNEERVFGNKMVVNERDMTMARHWLIVDVQFYTFPPPEGRSWSQWLDDVTVEINVFLPLGDGKGKVAQCGVLGGKQTLASLKVFDIPNKEATIEKDRKQHFVRMMIPPEIIYRYFAIKGTGKEGYLDPVKDYQKISDELGKFAKDLPIMVSISSSGRTLYAYQECGRSIYASLGQPSNLTTRGNSTSIKLFSALLKDEGDKPSLASTKKMFNYVNQNKFNPQTFKYMPDELLPVSKTPFAWVLFDRFEAIKETSGK